MEASKGPRYQHNRCKKAAKSAGQYEAYKTGRYQNNPHPEWGGGKNSHESHFQQLYPTYPKMGVRPLFPLFPAFNGTQRPFIYVWLSAQ
jgi:hypothetical protein